MLFRGRSGVNKAHPGSTVGFQPSLRYKTSFSRCLPALQLKPGRFLRRPRIRRASAERGWGRRDLRVRRCRRGREERPGLTIHSPASGSFTCSGRRALRARSRRPGRGRAPRDGSGGDGKGAPASPARRPPARRRRP